MFNTLLDKKLITLAILFFLLSCTSLAKNNGDTPWIYEDWYCQVWSFGGLGFPYSDPLEKGDYVNINLSEIQKNAGRFQFSKNNQSKNTYLAYLDPFQVLVRDDSKISLASGLTQIDSIYNEGEKTLDVVLQVVEDVMVTAVFLQCDR